MRGGGRENVAAVKRGRNGRFDHPTLVGDFASDGQAVAVEHARDQAVIGKHKKLAFPGFDDDGFAGSADAGVDDDEEYGAGGIVRTRIKQETRSFINLEGRDQVRDVHDAHIGCDADDHRFADGDGVVGSAEVCHKNDRGARSGLGRGLRERLLLRRGFEASRPAKSENDQQQKSAIPINHGTPLKNEKVYRKAARKAGNWLREKQYWQIGF